MICPKCGHEQAELQSECLRCGVIFSKWRERQGGAGELSAPPPAVAENWDEPQGLKNLLFPIPIEPNGLIVGGRALLLVLLGIWSCKFLFASIASNDAGQSVMHLVNLPFHEAGHIIFSPLGRFLQVLGGTLGQLLMPAVCLAVLLLKTRDAFGAAVALWWVAESFMDIAPYIDDARSLGMILLGGFTGREVADYHDWEYLLRTLGLLRFDHALAYLAQGAGILLMTAALLWGAAVLAVQFKACGSARAES